MSTILDFNEKDRGEVMGINIAPVLSSQGGIRVPSYT